MDDTTLVIKWIISMFGFVVVSFITVLSYIYRRDRTEHKEELKAQAEINKSIQENLTALTLTVVEEKGKIRNLERETFKKK